MRIKDVNTKLTLFKASEGTQSSKDEERQLRRCRFSLDFPSFREHAMQSRREVFVNTPPHGSPWQPIFVNAMLETSRRAPEKIAAAEHAISKRLQELALSSENAAELEALMSAINRLSRLKR